MNGATKGAVWLFGMLLLAMTGYAVAERGARIATLEARVAQLERDCVRPGEG